MRLAALGIAASCVRLETRTARNGNLPGPSMAVNRKQAESPPKHKIRRDLSVLVTDPEGVQHDR
jgi:hypothetical protein